MKPNPRLKVKLGISDETFSYLEKLYQEVDCLIGMINETDDEDISDLVSQLIKVETIIQTTWGFEDNPDRRYFTFLPEKCRCPKMDNLDAKNTGFRYINGTCPIHKLK